MTTAKVYQLFRNCQSTPGGVFLFFRLSGFSQCSVCVPDSLQWPGILRFCFIHSDCNYFWLHTVHILTHSLPLCHHDILTMFCNISKDIIFMTLTVLCIISKDIIWCSAWTEIFFAFLYGSEFSKWVFLVSLYPLQVFRSTPEGAGVGFPRQTILWQEKG